MFHSSGFPKPLYLSRFSMNIQKELDEIITFSEFEEDKALLKLRKCLQHLVEATTFQKIRIFEILGKISFRRNDFENAKKYLDEAEILSNQYGDTLIHVRIQMTSSDLLKRQGKFLEAVTKNKKILKSIESVTEDENVKNVRTSLCYGIATNLYYIGSYNEALEFGQRALNESEKLLPDAFQRGQPLEVLGLIFWELGNAEKAESLFKQAVGHYRKIKNLMIGKNQKIQK